MKRFELALDGECSVGKFSSVFVNAVEYGDKDYISSDETQYTQKATEIGKRLSGLSIGQIVDIIRYNGLDFDKILIDRSGISFDSFVETFSHNILLVSFNFNFDNTDILAYHD